MRYSRTHLLFCTSNIPFKHKPEHSYTLQCYFLTNTLHAPFIRLKQAFLFQVVALVHTLMTHKDINLRCVLVVAPLNTVLNWQVEFEKWLAVDDRLEVILSCFDIQL